MVPLIARYVTGPRLAHVGAEDACQLVGLSGEPHIEKCYVERRMRCMRRCALQAHCDSIKASAPELSQAEQVPVKRPHKGVLTAVTDQRFVIAAPARPGRVAEVYRYDRMASPVSDRMSSQQR